MTDILLFIWLAVLAAGLGGYLQKILNLDFTEPLEDFIFSFGLGLGIFSYLTFFLGLCGLFYRGLFWGIFILLSFIFLAGGCKKAAFLYKGAAAGLFKNNLFLKIILVIYALTALIGVLAPPTAWDVVVYHLSVPKLFIQQQRIFNAWHILQANLPFFTEMLYTLGLLIKGEILAGLFHFSMGIFIALAVYSFGKRFFSKETGVIAALIFYAMPVQVTLASAAFNDLTLAFFAFLAVYLFFIWEENQKAPYLIAAAIFSGISCSIKYLGLLIVLLLCAAIFLKAFRKKTVTKNIFLFLLVSGLTAFPWYLKNFIYTGDPLFPLLHGIISSALPPTAENLRAVMHQFPIESALKGAKDYIFYPFKLMLYPDVFDGWQWSAGPLYLLFIPLLLFVRGIDRKIKQLLLFCLGFLIVFLAMQLTYSRHAVLLFALLSIPASYGFRAFLKSDPLIRKIMLSVFPLVLILNLGFAFARQIVRIPVAFGMQSRDAYLSRRVNSYAVISYINKNLSPGSCVLVFDPRVYYHDKDYILAEPLYNPYLDYGKIKTIERFLSWMGERKITHLFVNHEYEDYAFSQLNMSFYRPMLDSLEGLKKKHLRLVYREKRAELYELVY